MLCRSRALIGLINAETTKHGNRIGSGMLRRKRPGTSGCFTAPESECVIGDDAIFFTHDKGARCAICLIDAGAAAQPVIQFKDAGIKFWKLVVIGQWYRCAEGHASSHGTLVDMVRFRRSLGCVGASSRARYSA